jgi:hypothetical protein
MAAFRVSELSPSEPDHLLVLLTASHERQGCLQRWIRDWQAELFERSGSGGGTTVALVKLIRRRGTMLSSSQKASLRVPDESALLLPLRISALKDVEYRAFAFCYILHI